MRFPYNVLDVWGTRNSRIELNQNWLDIAADINELLSRVQGLINGMPQPSEIVDIRTDEQGVTHPTANDRIVSEFQSVVAQIVATLDNVNDRSINVKKAGAVGDYDPVEKTGTDDTSAIQNVLNTLEAGDSLIFTHGNYKVSADITVPDGVSIKMTKKAHVYVTGGTKGFVLGNNCELITPHIHEARVYADVPNQTIGINADDKQNIIIHGGLVEGFTFANIGMSKVKALAIGDIETRYAGTKDDGAGGWEGQGIYISGGSEKVLISKVYAHDNGKHGIQAWDESDTVSVTGISVVDCICPGNGDTGIQLTEVVDYIVKGNHCNGNGHNGGPYGGQGIQSVSNSSLTKTGEIANNVALENTESGIEAVASSDVILTNNIANKNSWDGIKVWSSSKNVHLTANICNENGSNGIEANGNSITKSNGNTTRGNGSHGELYANCSYSIVTSPVSSNNGKTAANRSGIEFEGGDHAYLFSGIAFDDQSTHTQEYGARFYAVSGGAVYHFNTSGNKTRWLLIDGGSSGITLDNPSDQDIYFGGTTDVNGVRELSGSGSPEGIVTAPVGSRYHRIDGGTDQTLYIKESGTGNLGWRSTSALISGSSSNRPSDVPPGYQYFDTTLNKPIWRSNAKNWIDATGTAV